MGRNHKSILDLPKAYANKELTNNLRLAGSLSRKEALEQWSAIAQSFAPIIKTAIFDENTLDDIYTRVPVETGGAVRFPLDIIVPGTEDDYVAFTMPQQARVPERHVEGDELYVQTYRIANSIDTNIDFIKDARWDVVNRMLEVFRDGVVKRMNDDGWHVILASALSSGFMVRDTAAAAGNFTPALIYRMKSVQKRRVRNGDMTHLYISTEAWEDIRNWSTTEVSDNVREKLFFAPDFKSLGSIGGVQLRELRELGAGSGGTAEEYQEYFVTTLGGSLGAGGDTELVIGLDLSKRDAFMQIIRDDLEIFETGEQLHRQARMGFYGWMRLGFASTDNRRVIAGSF